MNDVASAVIVLLVAAAATAAYLWLFHGNVSIKEVGSTALAVMLGWLARGLWVRRAGQ